MSSKYIKKYAIPTGFQDLLSEFTKEILRNQPKDIIDFGIEYFKCLQQGLILDYAQKGENIPCDFKPAVPKIPASLKGLRNPIIESASPIQEDQKISQSIEKDENRSNEKSEIREKLSPKKIEVDEEDEKKIIKERVGNILSTSENASKANKSSPVITRTSGKSSIYENCIDFDEKEGVLQKLKENSEIEKEIEE